MSYYEYNDKYVNCQNIAPYKMYIFDVVNSRLISGDTMISNLQLLIFSLYTKIKKLAINENKDILHQSDFLNYTKLRKKEINNQIYYYLEPERAVGDSFTNSACLMEPFIIAGDCIGFSVNRGTISDETVYKLFEETKKELQIDYNFHKVSGYYETDNWLEGNNKYYRGYAIQLLSENNNKVLTKIKPKFNGSLSNSVGGTKN